MAEKVLTLLDYFSCAVVFLVVAVYARHRLVRWASLPYPPGPRGLPLLGNLFDFPSNAPWLTYNTWAKKYGDVVSLNAAGRVVVILNSITAARELLEKRGSVYADRPTIVLLQLMDMNFHLALSRYPFPWRDRRKLIDRSFRPSATAQYRDMQKRKTKQFLRKLLSQPEEFRVHITHCITAIMMSINYDYDLKETGDRYLTLNKEVSTIATESILPGSTIVNNLPFLKYLPGWLPGMGFQERAQRGLVLYQEMVNSPFDYVKEQWKKGAAGRSFTADNMKSAWALGREDDEDSEVKNSAATTNAAGIETVSACITLARTWMITIVKTGSVVTSLFLMLASYPDIQRKAQAELDAVVGRDRLPGWDDRANLPYVQAICNELLRWQPATPLGVSHATTEDDVYDGHFIPKGAVVLVNAWAILHDPSIYPSPEMFSPERHLTPDGNVKEDPLLTSAFGFGRRMCPGRHLAEATLWIIVASVLSNFNVTKAKDDSGKEIPVNVAYTDGLVSVPEPFQCSILPRDDKAARLTY
ncbi:cytochrome P450 [Artomyces pyxidatus]|uniref:Cytochrome P450 n=1 Tax=Artomyces pyxidatus TaxID=48021 RepID=A0ACB8SYY3_9AGAM|nr:cytochrome P450 [Artomyces pyxidatus]